jgi:regulatory protein
MRTRLALRGIDPPTIDDEIERLRGSGLLDDAKFAEAWVEDRKRLAPRGRRMLRYELLGRGIDPESAERATHSIDDGETALALARERARKTPTTSYEAFVAKVGGFLSRRGFDYEASARATRQVWQELQAARGEDGASAE